MAKRIIEINNLTKYYGKVKGIENVNFNVEEGDIFGFIGPNGSGKTTTIRTLMALIKPTSGNAKIFGLDCIKSSERIAKNIGYLPSETYYYENMKVKELLQYAEALYDVEASERIEYLSNVFKLDTNRKIGDLSTGNKKKVAIIVALLHSPQLIILDEPTSGLDPLIQKEFFNILREENEKGATILFSSHVLSDVQKISNKVAILKDGNIIKIHETNAMEKLGYKKISIRVKQMPSKAYFDIKGIADYSEENDQISFIYNGDISIIIERLSGLALKDVTIDEPNLEEVFLHYYQ